MSCLCDDKLATSVDNTTRSKNCVSSVFLNTDRHFIAIKVDTSELVEMFEKSSCDTYKVVDKVEFSNGIAREIEKLIKENLNTLVTDFLSSENSGFKSILEVNEE